MWSKRTWSAGCFKQTEWRVVPVRRTTRRGAWTACPVGHSRYWFKKATWIERATCWQEHADLGERPLTRATSERRMTSIRRSIFVAFRRIWGRVAQLITGATLGQQDRP